MEFEETDNLPETVKRRGWIWLNWQMKSQLNKKIIEKFSRQIVS